MGVSLGWGLSYEYQKYDPFYIKKYNLYKKNEPIKNYDPYTKNDPSKNYDPYKKQS